ncbi:MAG: NAD(P)-binding domain-containing protein [Candidatus Acidiferrales bacterium]
MLETAIVGAGPYGLSIAAHLRGCGIPFRIFGRPMDSWLRHMPKGMMLKSDGFASNICDPNGEFTLKRFCAEGQIDYSDSASPVHLDTFSAYGLAFQQHMVPELEDQLVTSIECTSGGFRLRLDDGEAVVARRIILAVGITHFEYVPPSVAGLSREFLSHSFGVRDLESFRSRRVAVIGGGASASDLAGLLQDAGADVQLISRQNVLKFHGKPAVGNSRSAWQRIRHPQSGLGPGLRSFFFANAPLAFHAMPESFRLNAVRTHLGPAGGWFAKDKVIGRVPLSLGCTVQRTELNGREARLHVRSEDGAEREILADRVIAATGYRVNMERLIFLSPEIRSRIKTVGGSPVLSRTFESSVPGMYFVGIAAANSFGPLMRFAFGSRFTARHLANAMSKAVPRKLVTVPEPQTASVAK